MAAVKRWKGPRHWPIGALVWLLILNAMSVGSIATEVRHHSMTLADWVTAPLCVMWVVWIADAIYTRRTR